MLGRLKPHEVEVLLKAGHCKAEVVRLTSSERDKAVVDPSHPLLRFPPEVLPIALTSRWTSSPRGSSPPRRN
jgi:hypothetical protein